MNAQHTPGPWTVGYMRPEDARSAIVYAIGTLPVAEAFATEGQHASESLANARMIAAAPEMADALEALVGQYAPEGYVLVVNDSAPLWAAARTALAAARGSSAEAGCPQCPHPRRLHMPKWESFDCDHSGCQIKGCDCLTVGFDDTTRGSPD